MKISRKSVQGILREDLGCFPYKKIKQPKFPTKVLVWLGVCGEGLTPPVIIEDRTIDAERYIDEILPIALKSDNKMLGKDWTYQQDGARPQTHRFSKKWCADHFPNFMSKDRWPPNSPDLCPLDYGLWNELAESMDWHNIQTKANLIQEIKRSVKTIKKGKIFTFCT